MGGRKAGTPNKATETVGAICRRHGLDVAEAMVMIVLDVNNPPERRDNMLLQLAKFQYAIPKAIEISGNLNLDTSRQDDELAKLRAQVKERIKERK